MGELAWDGVSKFSASTAPSVAIAALGGAGFEAYTSVTRDASRDRRGAGTAAVAVMDTVASDHKVMLMIVDGLTREQHEIVRGAYSVLGATVPIVGGCSADNLEYTRTLQFHGTGAAVEVLVDSVVVVGLGSSAPFGVGIDHGWEKHGNPMVVTRSEGGEVFLIDNEPAIDVYLRGLGADRSLLENEAKFREDPLRSTAGPFAGGRRGHTGGPQRRPGQRVAPLPGGRPPRRPGLEVAHRPGPRSSRRLDAPATWLSKHWAAAGRSGCSCLTAGPARSSWASRS